MTKSEIYEALSECANNVAELEHAEWDYLWRNRPNKNEDFLDDSNEEVDNLVAARLAIRHAMTFLED